MEELQKGLEVAGTGIGVVFAALVTLALVTMLLGKALRSLGAGPAAEQAAPAPLAAGAVAVNGPDDDGPDPALVAAMTAAVHFARRGVGQPAPIAPRPPAEAAGAWRVQGRQAFMASQGSRVRPRNQGR